jgi:hypothetical protein
LTPAFLSGASTRVFKAASAFHTPIASSLQFDSLSVSLVHFFVAACFGAVDCFFHPSNVQVVVFTTSSFLE